MSMNKMSLKGVGVLTSTVMLLATGFFVFNPLMEQRSENLSELKSMEIITQTQQANLSRLEAGAVDFEKALADGEMFSRIVPKSKDIESASRAISDAVIPGVTVRSFTFNPEEEVTEHKLPEVSLDAYTPPASFAEITSNSSSPAAPTSTNLSPGPSNGIKQLPISISLSAESYQVLSLYADNLSKQNRLLSVISISANNKSSDGEITADIYAYAFIDSTSQ